MAETVIFPLSEETGQKILAALLRIATALENGSSGGDEPGGDASVTASVSGRTLTLTGTGVSVADGRLTIDGAAADGRALTIG